ncbi:MAG: Manganese transport protein [Pseudonocardiales bacterium]|nr:Manganese transport protein [Pseudonocardiales bacterium]
MNVPLARITYPKPEGTDSAEMDNAEFDPRTGRGFVSGGRLLGLVGPAFVAAVAFVDPGNIAINVSAGADYRYLLLWTVVTASLMAMVVQYLSAKLGMATGCSLAEVCRENTTTPVRISLWLVAELVVIMTDVAEFVGGAIALNLLFGLPMFVGGLIVAAVTVFILRMRVGGRDTFPMVVVGLLLVLVMAFLYLAIRSPFDPVAALSGLAPRLGDSHSALLACGIVGATVMPHAVFLHSSLVSGLDTGVRSIRTGVMLRYLRRDVVMAMGVAGLVNVLMLLVATSLPIGSGNSLGTVHSAFRDREGAFFAAVFAIGLLASGLASACAGVYSGQAIMAGFLRRNSNIWLRRAVSSLPALVILAVVSDPTQALVMSQVVLSFGLPFALIPLILFTARPSVMGRFVNQPITTATGVLITSIVLLLNGFLLIRLFIA